jgi:tetratricopeptide (TPR) repeat protein
VEIGFLCLAAALSAADAGDSLEKGTVALKTFKVEEAVQLLERARAQGPYTFANHVRLYEQLGVAYAYLGRQNDALAAFDMLLALDPGHVLPCTLSPQVTFLFERARQASDKRQAPVLQVSWPRELRVQDPVPLTMEVMADPKAFLKQVKVYSKRQGDSDYEKKLVDLPAVGGFGEVVVPAMSDEPSRPEVLQLYVTALDKATNEVFLVGSAEHPREISLRYEPPVPWYNKWWIWAAAGGVLAVGAGVAVYAYVHELPTTVGGAAEFH